MSIPSSHTCYSLMDEYDMLDNIRAHSIMVARVSQVLLLELTISSSSPRVPSKELVLAGALLHDIAKTPCLKERCDHAKKGRDICQQHGYAEVAEVVREHVMLTEFSPDRYTKGHFLAKEIVYYADKRVLHDEIVSLEQRLDYIIEYYGNNDPARHALIRENFTKCQELESFLFSTITSTPDIITEAANNTELPVFHES